MLDLDYVKLVRRWCPGNVNGAAVLKEIFGGMAETG